MNSIRIAAAIAAGALLSAQGATSLAQGPADGVRLDHIAEMYRLKGGEVHGDMRPRSESRLAILPDTTHVTLMNRWQTIVPMINDFLDAKPQKQ